MRNHSVQYVSEPEFGWYRLRRAWPWVYESHAELALETWTKVRIEVAGRAAKLYLNGSSKPSLIVDGLKGQDLRGGVGLWSFTDEEAYFSNVRIMPEEPLSVKNGSDAAGFWEMRYSSDAGGMDASMELHRDGSKVTGTWSGPLGENRAITGTCRNGYVERSFVGEWPKESRQGVPGPATVLVAGWIDGDSGKGRMRVEGRSDGTWVAKRRTKLNKLAPAMALRGIYSGPHDLWNRATRRPDSVSDPPSIRRASNWARNLPSIGRRDTKNTETSSTLMKQSGRKPALSLQVSTCSVPERAASA